MGNRAERDLCRRRRRQRHPDDQERRTGRGDGPCQARGARAADLVTGDHDEDGVAMLVDDVLLPGMADPQPADFPASTGGLFAARPDRDPTPWT